MTDKRICDEYERLISVGKLKWIKVSHKHLPPSTRAYCRMWLDDNKIKYKVATLRLGGTILFKVDDKFVHYLHHDPKQEKHMWADEGFHSFIENNEALARLSARHSKSSKEALKIAFDGIDAVQGTKKRRKENDQRTKGNI